MFIFYWVGFVVLWVPGAEWTFRRCWFFGWVAGSGWQHLL